MGLLSPASKPSILPADPPLIQRADAGGGLFASPTTGPTVHSVPLPAFQATGTEGEHGDHAVRPVAPESIQDAIQAAAPEDGDVVVVRMRNKFFDPPVVVIHEGDTVVWVNETAGGWHDVQSYEGEFSSDRMVWSDAFVHTFDEPGVHGFFCSPHVIDGMQGAVVVLPKASPLPDPLPMPAPPTSSPVPGASIPADTPDTIVTVAGGGGNGGLATDASLYLPEGVAIDDAGRLYIADTENCQVRRVDTNGTVVSLLGHESCGFSMGGDADLGPWLHTNHPRAVAVGPDGALYVADTVNCRVRRVQEGGRVATVAGNDSCRASGDGGPAADAGLSPWGLAWDTEGNLYVADVFNCRIRQVDGAGIITTVAGNGTCGFAGDGGPATEAALFFPRDVAVGPDGSLYIADTENCRVRRVDAASGIIDTVAGNGSCAYSGDGAPAALASLHPWAVAVDSDANVLAADRQNCRLRQFAPGGLIATIAGTGVCGASGDGGPAEQALLHWPSDVAITADGAIYLADTGSCRIRRLAPEGMVTTVAGSGVCAPGGDGGPAIAGGIWHPTGLAFGKNGAWYFSELDTCRVRRVDPDGVVSTYAGTGVCGFSGDGGPATEARLSDFLGGLALAQDGTLYVAEGYNCRVRRVDPNGIIDTVAGTGACDFSGDGGPATDAALNFVSDVALGESGTLYLAEPFNCRVRRVVLTTGIIDTVIGDGSCRYNGEGVPALAAGVDPWGVAVGPDRALYVADSSNARVRRLGAGGRIVTVAGGNEVCDGRDGDGGPAIQARLFRPYDIVLDRAGNLYVADLRAFVVRKVDREGVINTIAGVGISRPIDVGGHDPTNGFFCSVHNLPVPQPTYLNDGAEATEAGLYFPYAIALDEKGDLLIADTFDHRVRRVACGGSVPCAGQPAPNDAPGSVAPPPVTQLPSTGAPPARDALGPLAGLLAAAGAAITLYGLRDTFGRSDRDQRR